MEVAYILVKGNPTKYEVVDKAVTEPIPPESTLDPLLDDANEFFCGRPGSEPKQVSEIRAYTLKDPISSYDSLTMFEIEETLGDINHEFLRKKTFSWTPRAKLRQLRLDEGQGQVVIVFTMQEEPERSADREFDEEEQHTDQGREMLVELASRRNCPSTGSKNSTLLQVQQRGTREAVYNGRPIELKGPSITIYHPVFATFKAKMAAPIDTFQIKPEDVRLAYDVMKTSLIFYENEAKRHSALKACLPRAIDPSILDNQAVYDAPVDKFEVDGMGFVDCEKFPNKDRAAAYFAELKNGIGEGSSDPIHQAECDYVLFCCAHLRRLIRQSCCCPAFLIGIAGPYISISGAVFADRFVCQRLLSYVYLGEDPTKEGQIDEIAKIFKVLKECIAELKQYYSQLEPRNIGPSPSSMASQPGSMDEGASHGRFLLTKEPIPATYPHFKQFESNGKTVKLEYCGRLLPRESAKAVFKAYATTSDDGYQKKSTVVVKFTPTYCKEAHELLAEKGYAPKLWLCEYVERVCLLVVVMDFVEGSPVDGPLSQGAAAALKVAISILHSRDLVFGDLRSPNVIIPNPGSGFQAAILVDFDWSGREGVVCYPVHVNVDQIMWPRGVCGRELITKEHDTTMLERLAKGSP